MLSFLMITVKYINMLPFIIFFGFEIISKFQKFSKLKSAWWWKIPSFRGTLSDKEKKDVMNCL